MTQEIAMCQACGAEMLRLSASEHVCLECPPAHDEVFTLDLSTWPASSQVAPDMALPSIPTDKDAHVEAHQDSAGLDLPGHDQERDLGAVEGAPAMVTPRVDAAGRCRAQGGDTSNERALFEAWGGRADGGHWDAAYGFHRYSDDIGGKYSERDVQTAWEGWQERARLAATTQASTAQAEPKVWSASEALLYAARVVELYDDATMQGDYMIDSKDCAAILTAMASMPMLAATSSTDAQAAPTDISQRLRGYADTYGHPLRTDLLAAVEEIERYYGGMMAWKRTAEARDAGTQAAAEVRDAWISVDEPLPEKECLAVYLTPAGKQRLIRAKYARQFQIEAEGDDCETEYNEDDDTFYLKAGWLECVDNWGEYSSCYVTEGTVTHWMPSPALPGTLRAGDTGEQADGGAA
jgi:hypothetical protein